MLVYLVLLLSCGFSSAYLYGDVWNAYCWLTNTSTCIVKDGVKTNCVKQLIGQCPPSLVMTWITGVPPTMDDSVSYEVSVNITLPPQNYNLTHIPAIYHFNIHACRTSVGICTPNVVEVPDLVTKTISLNGSLIPGTDYAVFNQHVQLSSGDWWVIAHVTFDTADLTWDAAIGVNPTVMPRTSEQSLLQTALITMFSIFVFVIAIFFVRVWLKKREQSKIKLSDSLRKALIREIITLVIDCLTGMVSRALQIYSFKNIYEFPSYKQFGVVLPYAVFTVLATCATIIVLFFKFNLIRKAVNQLLGKRKKDGKDLVTIDSVLDMKMPKIADAEGVNKTVERMDSMPAGSPALVRPDSIQWDLKHCDIKLQQLDRTIRNMQIVIVMCLVEDVPLIAINVFLLVNFNQIVTYWTFVASICWSIFALGYHLSYLQFLREAWFQYDKILVKIDLLNASKDKLVVLSPPKSPMSDSPPGTAVAYDKKITIEMDTFNDPIAPDYTGNNSFRVHSRHPHSNGSPSPQQQQQQQQQQTRATSPTGYYYSSRIDPQQQQQHQQHQQYQQETPQHQPLPSQDVTIVPEVEPADIVPFSESDDSDEDIA